MRIRLLLDVDMTSGEVILLQEIIDTQPEADVQIIENFSLLRARLMGATPVEGS